LGYLLVGRQSTVHGKDASGNWWYIENPKKPGEFCWVWEGTTQVSGDTSQLPLMEAPPLIQPSPEETETPDQPDQPPSGGQPEVLAVVVNYLDVFSCGSTSYALFEVVNNGNVDLYSADVVLQEQDTHQSISGYKS
jgi:hypothetical protein